MVTHFSTNGRTSLAFCSVVMMRPFTLGTPFFSPPVSRSVRIKADARFRSRARW